MLIEEIQHLMDLDPETGVERLSDSDAMTDRIEEWFETPEGTVADLPAWGHNLVVLKHEPTTPRLEMLIKSKVLRKMPIDIRNLQITNIGCQFIEIDLFHVLVVYRIGPYQGKYQGEVRL